MVLVGFGFLNFGRVFKSFVRLGKGRLQKKKKKKVGIFHLWLAGVKPEFFFSNLMHILS